MRNLCCLFVLIPAVSLAEKPNCETIKKAVETERQKLLIPLEAELEKLETLRNDIRKGRGRLEGNDGKKSRRDQLRIVVEKIDETNEKLKDLKASNPLPNFTIRDLKVGDFGHFGKDDYDFRIVEIIDGKTFTAFIRYRAQIFVNRRVGTSTVSIPSQTTKTTSALYFVKGIDTKGLVDGKMANWKGSLWCSGTKKLELNSGNETVFVLEPLDTDACFQKP